jgi:predicted dehydrogenase
VRRVTAFAGVAFPERQVNGQTVRFEAEEDQAQILLDFGEAVLGVLTTGWTMRRYRSPAIELFGDLGTVHLLGEDWAPEGYQVGRQGEEAWETVPEPQPPWLWPDGLRHFVECIHRGRRPSAMAAHALHVLEVILLAKAAARDGRAREVASAFDPEALLDRE